MKIAFFGSSLLSSYRNGEATCHRGLLKALAGLGHDIVFYEPDALGRQHRRDISDPPWARVVVYEANTDGWQRALAQAAQGCDLVAKATGVGVFDTELEEAVPELRRPDGLCALFDMDAPETLDAIAADPGHHLRDAVPRYDLVLAFGGGALAVNAYGRLGARRCVPLYAALDPAAHFPVRGRLAYRCDLNFLANRVPEREARVDGFFVRAASILRHHSFVLGGAGWHGRILPANIACVGHIGTDHHNAFFGSGLATLNISRHGVARYGYSPPPRIFEASGAGACLITDAVDGIDEFLEPDYEVLVATGGEEVAEIVAHLPPEDARAIAAAARARILAHHTWERRAREVHAVLEGVTQKDEAAA